MSKRKRFFILMILSFISDLKAGDNPNFNLDDIRSRGGIGIILQSVGGDGAITGENHRDKIEIQQRSRHVVIMFRTPQGFRIEDNTGRFYFDAREGQERRADRDALDRPFLRTNFDPLQGERGIGINAAWSIFQLNHLQDGMLAPDIAGPVFNIKSGDYTLVGSPRKKAFMVSRAHLDGQFEPDGPLFRTTLWKIYNPLTLQPMTLDDIATSFAVNPRIATPRALTEGTRLSASAAGRSPLEEPEFDRCSQVTQAGMRGSMISSEKVSAPSGFLGGSGQFVPYARVADFDHMATRTEALGTSGYRPLSSNVDLIAASAIQGQQSFQHPVPHYPQESGRESMIGFDQRHPQPLMPPHHSGHDHLHTGFPMQMTGNGGIPSHLAQAGSLLHQTPPHRSFQQPHIESALDPERTPQGAETTPTNPSAHPFKGQDPSRPHEQPSQGSRESSQGPHL